MAAQRAEAAKDPVVQKGRWLKGVADLIEKCQAKRKQAEQAQFPNNMQETYKNSFAVSLSLLTDIRSYLEAAARSSGSITKKLKEGHKAVTETKNDIKAFDLLFNTYCKS